MPLAVTQTDEHPRAIRPNALLQIIFFFHPHLAFQTVFSEYFITHKTTLLPRQSTILSYKLLRSIISTTNQPPTTNHHQSSKWSTPLPPAARPTPVLAASAPPRPSAPAARRALFTALATSLPLRTPPLAPAAHAVCLNS
jgi:hypothetical protein